MRYWTRRRLKDVEEIGGEPMNTPGGSLRYGSKRTLGFRHGFRGLPQDAGEDAGGGEVTLAISGTAAEGLTESQVVAGGETIILTLTNAEWHEGLGDENFDAEDVAFGNSITWEGDPEQQLEWSGFITIGAQIVRTSDTVLTITLGAAGQDYAISQQETVTFEISTGCLKGDVAPENTVNFVVTPD